MKSENLGQLLKVQRLSNDISYSRWELLLLINRKVCSFENKISKKFRREIIACMIVIATFGVFSLIASSILMKAGCIIIVLSSIFISHKLMKARKEIRKRKPAFQFSIRKHLKMELHRVETWKKLLARIGRWYISPFFLGLLLFTLGSQTSYYFKANYLLIIASVSGLIWYYNQRTISSVLEPLIFEIKQSIKFANHSE